MKIQLNKYFFGRKILFTGLYIMKNFLIFILFVFSLIVSAEPESSTSDLSARTLDAADEVDTEAGAGCTTPECLGAGVGSPDLEVAELCRSTLPAHCQKIKDIKLTTCYDDQAGFGGGVGASGLSCALGILEGVVDIGAGVGNAVRGTWNFAFDSEYREEFLNAASFFFRTIFRFRKNKTVFIRSYFGRYR